MDLAHDGRGVARVDGKAVFIEGALPSERVRFRVAQAPPADGRGGLGRGADRLARSRRAALRPLWHLRRLLLAAFVARGAAAPPSSANCSRICSASATYNPQRVLDPLRGPEWAYRRRARLGIKYVHKKGRVLAGFRERDKPYIADIRRCEVLLAPLRDAAAGTGGAGRDLDDSGENAASRSGGGGSRNRIGVSGAGDARAPRIWRSSRHFGAQRGLQIFLQPGGLDTVRPLRADYPPLDYTVDGGNVVIEFGPVDFIQVNRDINAVHGGCGDEAAAAASGRYGARSVLRSG